ncbi:transposase [Marinobacterium sp. YM272]|uniref:transposase n=1 Tax=Marinobacterium sp. YM272 TaxID=3421654 RepID=UPI003D7FBF32
MTNHVHLLATPLKAGAVSAMMQHLGRHYVRYFNRAYQRTGTLWEGRFKSCLVQSEQYLLTCQRYIELNPVRARMVGPPADYHWSSYHAHAQGIDTELWTPHELYLSLGKNGTERQQHYQALFVNPLPSEQLQRIQQSVNQGLALGNDRFRNEIEILTGVRQKMLKAGRKKKKEEG